MDAFIFSVVLGLLAIFIGGINNSLLGWIIVLLGFMLYKPVRISSNKEISDFFNKSFFAAWFIVITLSAVFFINLFNVPIPNGFSWENTEAIILGVVFLTLMIVSIYLFIYRLLQSYEIFQKINEKLNEKNIGDYESHCGEDG